MTNQKLGLSSAISAGIGLIVATSCLVTLSQGVGFAGKGFIIALAIACGLNILVSFSFAELNGLMPVTGGLGQYTLAAMGPFVSMIAVIGGYIICGILAASSEAAMIGFVVNSSILPNISPLLITLISILFLFIINAFGIRSYARTQMITTVIMIGSMIIIGVMGALKLGSGEVVTQANQAFNPMGFGVVSMTALAFWLFIGVEFVLPLTKDMKKPEKDIPRGMILALLILMVVQSIMIFGISNYVPHEILQTSNQPHMEFARLLLGKVGTGWMTVISIGAVVSTLNTILAGIPRMLLGMAEGGMLPKVFTKTNRYGVPYNGLFLITGGIVTALLTGITSADDLIIFILTGCLFWMASYIVAHLNVLVLRKRYPDAKRSFCVKLFGLPQIVGILGMIYMMTHIIDVPDLRNAIYSNAAILMMALVAYCFVWVKFVMKKGLFETISMEEVIAQDENSSDLDLNNDPDYDDEKKLETVFS
ncbi:APC family permease [uncultured Ilyobacter sp.]|uniref:APC family permease n=1 Tax=uncultured Ilyobacter sp. TaxID=544433 RepID=UPI0029C0B91B|nr:APC family permease [uncultured Ilyobacter sp.]